MAEENTRCKDVYDLYRLIYGKKYSPIRKDSSLQLKKAKEIWDKLLEEGIDGFQENGCIEILSDNKSVRLKNKKPGRPPATNSMDIKKTIRMDHETATKLDNYCQTNNIKLSEAIRIAINKL